MKCSEAMNTHAATVRAHASIRVVADTMIKRDATFFPVIGKDGDLAGTITDREILRHATSTGLDVFHTAVAHIASLDALTCSPEDEVSTAEQKMKEAHQARILVVGVESGRKYLGLIALDSATPAHAPAEGAA